MDRIDTKGVLTRPAGVAFALLVFVGTLLFLGWRARTAFEAQAATPEIAEKLEQIRIDVAVIKTKVEALERRR